MLCVLCVTLRMPLIFILSQSYLFQLLSPEKASAKISIDVISVYFLAI